MLDNPYLRLKALFQQMNPRMYEDSPVDLTNFGFPQSVQDDYALPRLPEIIPTRDEDVERTFGEAPLPPVIPASKIGSGDMAFESGYDPSQDPNQMFLELYKPDKSASERLDKILAVRPERNKPGFGRKLAASLTGFSGNIKNADEILYSPYYRAMEDWKAELEPAWKAASLENQSNAQLRMIANNIMSQRMAEERLKRQRDRDEVLREQGEKRIDLSGRRVDQGDVRLDQGQQRIDLQKELAEGGRPITDDFGNVYILTRKGELKSTGIKNISWEDKETFKTDENIREAKEKPVRPSAGQRPRLAASTTTDPNTGEVIRGVINLDEGTFTPIQEGSGRPIESKVPETTKKPVTVPQTELEKGREITNKARKIASANVGWAPYIKFDKSGRFTGIQQPISYLGVPTSGPSKENYAAIYRAIYGKEPPGHVPGYGNNKNQSALPAGKVKVRNKQTGQTGTVSEAVLKAYPNKYERVQ